MRHRHLRKAHNTREQWQQRSCLRQTARGSSMWQAPSVTEKQVLGDGYLFRSCGAADHTPKLLLASVAPPFLLGQACC